MNNLSSISLNDYDLSYTEFAHWVVENGISAYAVNSQGGNNTAILYFFEDLEDFTAFTLKFPKIQNRPLSYKGKSVVDAAAFYAPYIPPTNK